MMDKYTLLCFYPSNSFFLLRLLNTSTKQCPLSLARAPPPSLFFSLYLYIYISMSPSFSLHFSLFLSHPPSSLSHTHTHTLSLSLSRMSLCNYLTFESFHPHLQLSLKRKEKSRDIDDGQEDYSFILNNILQACPSAILFFLTTDAFKYCAKIAEKILIAFMGRSASIRF